ncbi:hypothetical protein G6O67_002239 [Ophiocordyceps sinensis]|uniref:gamma-glutamylcyclotransferase n=1 Tax=Ophiocordyceps sinensis TaxID=72228 RepID=A0A8H4PTZ3_9HYPO|nr:hypothetical protein G6O67_002239 [Ophiocordyceps sinensis]
MDMGSHSPQEDSQPSQDSVMTVTQETRHEVLYFAYGSNMSTAQMRQRCPHSTPVGLGLLQGWTWIINERGYANVVATVDVEEAEAEPKAKGVYGLLYLLPPQDEERLDGYEGVPWAYEKVACEARMERAVEDAVGNWGLDEDYANKFMRRFWA